MPSLKMSDITFWLLHPSLFCRGEWFAVLGNVFVGEVNHNVFFFQHALQFANVDVGNTAVFVNGKARRVCRRLPRQNCRGNYTDNIPTIPFGGGGASCRQHIGIIFSSQSTQGNFVQEISEFKIVDGANGIVKMFVCVLFSESVIAVQMAGGSKLRHQRDLRNVACPTVFAL